MKFKGKGINLQVLVECLCYLLFGFELFHLTYSGAYLNYVTPRMKPYLYGMSILMVLFAAVEGRRLLSPRYRVKLYRSFVFIIPILLLSFRPAVPDGSSMIRSGTGMPVTSSLTPGLNGKNDIAPKLNTGSTSGANVLGQNDSNQSDLNQSSPAQSAPDESSPVQSDSAQPDEAGAPTNPAQPDEAGAPTNPAPQNTAASQDQQQDGPQYELYGLDEKTKTITVADEDFYTWLYELSAHPKKYLGYTVIMKGFIYQDADVKKEGDFALVRLSMWCCAADMMPIGFVVDCGGKLNFKPNDWVTVKGTFEMTPDGSTMMLKAQDIKAAAKPKEEYVYPSF